MKVFVQKDSPKAYHIAAGEFVEIYKKITGITLEISYTPTDENEDMVVIGGIDVNKFTASLYLNKEIDDFDFKIPSDGYNIRSFEDKNRTILFFAAGRERAILYAVYRYFEKYYNCSYFWDGDIIPQTENCLIKNIDLFEEPKFEYRGIRYFAHRSLERFQAEHWSFEDWKKEIDWMLKKRLNMFMLRIGLDDIFQKAFPDVVKYPDDNNSEHIEKRAYFDRTEFWSLEYRGDLRKKILDYAFERDLIHPEDIGTITHWYGQTPVDFLKKVNPKLLDHNEEATLEDITKKSDSIWDIRDDANFDNYCKLTETHIREYGRDKLFHMIGMAEKTYSKDKEVNFRLKNYAYKRFFNYISENHPNSKVLLASWDFFYKYNDGKEVEKMLKSVAGDNVIVFDYTSDSSKWSNNFTNWGVVGNIPYIFGMFQGYEPENDIRGKYDITESRLKVAANDNMCKGMVFWPELSHGDVFALEYFADNAWNPLAMDFKERTSLFCQKRYDEKISKVMNEIWDFCRPVFSFEHWSCLDCINCIAHINFHIVQTSKLYFEDADYALEFGDSIKDLKNHLENTVKALRLIQNISIGSSELLKRDIYDILRTICQRYIQFYTILAFDAYKEHKNEGIQNYEIFKKYTITAMELLSCLTCILGGHKDFSLNVSLEKLKKTAPVNPLFEKTLKKNAECEYNRSYIYENAKYLYTFENQLVFDWCESYYKNGVNKPFEEIIEEQKKKALEFIDTPLVDMAPTNICDLKTVIENMITLLGEN